MNQIYNYERYFSSSFSEGAFLALLLNWLVGLQAADCSWKRLDDCTDHVENALYFDEVFNENESVVITNMGRCDLFYCILVQIRSHRFESCNYTEGYNNGKD